MSDRHAGSDAVEVLAHGNENILYSERYDAYYSKETGEWLEKQCSDPGCTFCVGRPAHPDDARRSES